MSEDSGIGHNGGPSLSGGNDGYIKLYRSIADHWLVGFGKVQPPPAQDTKRPAYCYTVAFQDLLFSCRYRNGWIDNGGTKMEIRRGELVGAVSYLAARWNWSPKAVRTFLDKLENDGMIERKMPGVQNGKQKGKQSAVITISNYEKFQGQDSDEGQAGWQARGTQGASTGHARGNNKKKGKREECITPPSPPEGGDAPAAPAASDKGGTSKRQRGTRLPAGWVLPKSWGDWALEHFEVTTDAIRTEAATFRDYWQSRPGAQACKLDWLATWRNWVRSSAARNKWRIRKPETDAAPAVAAQSGIEKKKTELASLNDKQQRDLVAKHANGIWPMDKLLYPPSDKRCVIRPENYHAVGIDEDTYDEHGVKRDGH